MTVRKNDEDGSDRELRNVSASAFALGEEETGALTSCC